MSEEALRPSGSLAAYGDAMMNAFGVPQLVLVRGEGVYVWAEDGTRYLDLLGGIAVNALGYAHPALIEAVSSQMETLSHVSNYFATPPQIELARRLQKILDIEGYRGADARVFFTNSGTEANEAALKMTRLHKPGGRVLALTGCFHGRTMGALSITSKAAYREPFEPLPGNAEFVEPTVQALEGAFGEDVAALFVEPIRGEAGVLPVADEVLAKARELCDANGALLVVDEVQTGIGRTGRWLASGGRVLADILTFAKGLGGGVPIGACVGIGEAGRLFAPGNHGTTFGGNPLACAAANATLETVSGLLGHVEETGAWLRGELARLGYAVRGRGLLIGIEVADAPGAHKMLLAEGIITNAANPTTLRLAPPLLATAEELAPFVAAMARHAGEFQASASVGGIESAEAQ